MPATAIPASIDALVTATRTAVGQAAQVLDGPPVRNVERDLVCVGYSTQRLSAEGSQVPASMGQARSEDFDVVCSASSWSGDNATKVVRDRASALVDLVEAGLVADPRLGGAVLRAVFGDTVVLDQVQVGEGVAATIEFTVRIRAMVR